MPKFFTVILATLLAWIISGSYTLTHAQGIFQPANVPFSGADLDEATDNALANWETQCGKPADFFGRVTLNFALPNDQFVLDYTNQVRAAINGRTITLGGNTVTFACGPLTMSSNLTNFGSQWKQPRRLLHYANNCDGSVHNLDTTTVFSCLNTSRSPIAQWKKWGITNAQAAFGGESNGEFWLDPDDGEALNFSDATQGSLYGWWFLDGPGAPYYQNWGHLNHMRFTFSTKLGYHVFYLDEVEGKVSTYVWHSKVEVILPIELLSFTAEKVEEENLLNWATASEKNNDRFEIERSQNGKEWEIIGQVIGANDSQSRLDYFFSDKQPLDGLAYYRLRQIDFDGQESLSPVRQVTRPLSLLATASPNPTSNLVSFSGLPDIYDSNFTITVTDFAGRTVAVANNSNTIDLSAQPAGLYIAMIRTDNGLQNLRLMKK